MAAATTGDDAGPQRLYDREADCALFAPAGIEARRATWDGPCIRGLATGNGTAVFFTADRNAETIDGDFRGGRVLDGDAGIHWADGAHYEGGIAAGQPEGEGVLVNAKGDRYTGDWKGGLLNGHGAVIWANGDRYDGEWRDGKAEGHGVQLWADGQKYDGAWRNDLPNGQGTVTHKDGTQFAALFVDGKRQMPAVAETTPAAASVAASAEAPSPATHANATPAVAHAVPAPPYLAAAPDVQRFLDGFTGATLTGIDGSKLALTLQDGGLVRTLTGPDGTIQKSVFVFLGNGLGTVSDAGTPPQVTGFFRIAADRVEVQYADGHAETLTRNGADGLAIVLKTASGELACAAWYPQGHVYTAGERKAAVAAYAQRMGVAFNGPALEGGCAAQTAAPIAVTRPAPAIHGKPPVTTHTAPASLNALQNVPVRNSVVHVVDAVPDETAPDAAAAIPPRDERIASDCLKVDSDGSYWGFRNHCGYSVQFSYCLLHGVDEMTACGNAGAVSVPGSVSANGFGALFTDDSLAERGVSHEFRWVGCRGGAGEVSAHLDRPDPASGRCLRASRTMARDN